MAGLDLFYEVNLDMRFSMYAATVAVAMLLAGCGGGGSGPGGPVPATPAPTPTGGTPSAGPSVAPSKSPTAAPSTTPVPSPSPPPPTNPPPTIPPASPSPTAAPVINATSSPVALSDNPAEVLGDRSTFNATGATTFTPIDGIACTGPLNTRLQHFHDHLSVFVNGKQYAVPAAIGIYLPSLLFGPPTAGYYNIDQSVNPTACHYDIHVHTGDGVIHIESPNLTQTFTLKNFLDIWGITISPVGFMGFTGPTHWYLTKETYPSPYSRDRQVQDITAVDPATIVLSAHLEFTVEVGTPVNTPNYQFFDFDL